MVDQHGSVKLLRAGLVAIFKGSEVSGTGFLVKGRDSILVVTAAHALAKLASANSPISLRFIETETKGSAAFVPEWHRPEELGDFSVLRLSCELPPSVKPLPLGSAEGTEGHEYLTLGLPDIDALSFLPESGKITGSSRFAQSGLSALILKGGNVTSGFSGAPVWDVKRQRAIGVIAFITARDENGRLSTAVGAIPTEVLTDACELLAPSDQCPYLNLAAYDEHTSNLFFGRDADIGRIVSKLNTRPRLTCVTGPSGSGKSSIVFAGVMPQLGHMPGFESRILAVRRPTTLMQALSERLNMHAMQDQVHLATSAAHSGPILIIVDQFEDLLVDLSIREHRQILLALEHLIESWPLLSVLIVLRSDFYGRLIEAQPRLLRLLETGMINVSGALSRNELCRIVEGPASHLGYSFESGLIDGIINSAIGAAPLIEDSHGARSTVLPMLEVSLTRLWQSREDGQLLWSAFNTMGGVTGALASWAQKSLDALTDDDRRTALTLLTELTSLGDPLQGIPDTKRRRNIAYRASSTSRMSIGPLIKHLADSHLVITYTEGAVEYAEIIHEALFREWDVLRIALNERRSFLRWRSSVESRIADWTSSGLDINTRDHDLLLRGSSLAEAAEWEKTHGSELTDEEITFLALSRARRDEETQKWRELYENVSQQATLALARHLTVQSELLRMSYPHLTEIAVLLAAESLHRCDSVEGNSALRKGMSLLLSGPEIIRQVSVYGDRKTVTRPEDILNPTIEAQGSNGEVASAKWHKDKTSVSVVDNTGILSWIRDVGYKPVAMRYTSSGLVLVTSQSVCLLSRSGEMLRSVMLSSSCSDAAFSSDGALVAVSSAHLSVGPGDNVVSIWELKTFKELARITALETVYHCGFSADNQVVAFTTDALVRVWNISGPEEVSRLLVPRHSLIGVNLNDDATEISAVGESEKYIWREPRPWGRTGTQSFKGELVGHSQSGGYVAVSTAALLEVVEVSTREKRCEFAEPDASSIAFTRDGEIVAIGQDQGEINLWRCRDSVKLLRLECDSTPTGIAFSSSGQLVGACTAADYLSVWSCVTGELLFRRKHPTTRHDEPVFYRDEFVMAVPLQYEQFHVWSLQGDTVLELKGGIDSVQVNEAGMVVVLNDLSGELHIFQLLHDNARGDEIPAAYLQPKEGTITATCLHPRDQIIAVAEQNRSISIWNVGSKERQMRFPVTAIPRKIAYSPSAKYLAVLQFDANVDIWDCEARRKVAQCRVPDEADCIAFSQSDRYVLASSKASHPGRQEVSVSLWQSSDLLELARLRVTRNMSEEEWEQYVGPQPYRKTFNEL